MDDTDTNIDETLPGDDSDIENLDTKFGYPQHQYFQLPVPLSYYQLERLFSWGRLSKTYLQGQMSPTIHSRNVFLNKCQHLL